MANIVDLLIGLGIDADSYTSGIAKAAGETDSFVNRLSSSVAPAIAAAFAGGAVAVGAFVATSVTAAGDFEAAVNNLAAVSGSSLADAGFSFDDVSAKALELGQTTAYSASQSIAAMTELVKGGVPVAEVMGDATAATLDLAAAGGVDLANAAEIVSKQLGVWSDTGIDARMAADLLASAANASTVGVEELALGLSNVNGSAKVAGVEFEDLVQTMALIAPGFSSASDAGTSLKTMISRLIPTTKDAIAAAQDIGIVYTDWRAAAEELGVTLSATATQADAQTAVAQRLSETAGTATELSTAMAALAEDFQANAFYDASGNFLGMENAARALHEATKDLSEEQKILAFNTIFGSDAIRAAAMVAEAGATGFNDMGAAMAAAGTAADVAAIQNQGFNFAVDSMLGSLETLQIIVGTALLPVLTALINDAIIPGIGAVSNFVSAIQNSNDPIMAIVNAVSTFSPLLANLIGYFLVLIVEGDRLNDFFAALPAPIQSVITIATTLAGMVRGNLTPILIGLGAVAGGVVVSALASMIASVLAVAAPIAAAVAIVAVMYAAYQSNFAGIQTAVNTVMASVNSVITSVMGAVLTFWQNNGAQIMAFAQQTWTQISTIISNVVTIISTIVSKVFGFIADFISKHGAQIQNVFTTAWNYVSGIVTNALTVIQGIVTATLGLITGDSETFSAGLGQIFEGLFGLLETTFTSGVDLLQGIFNGALELIRGVLSSFVGDANGLGQNIINGVVDGVKNGVGALISAVQNAAKSALDAAKKTLGIKSPSREGYYIGEMFMLGPINAIYDMMPALETASASMAGVLADTASAVPGVSASTPSAGTLASVGAAAGGAGVNQTWNIDAHYTTVQDELTIRDTIRRQAILNASFGA